MTLICPNIYVQNLKQNIYSLHERFFFWKIVIKVSKRNDNIFPSVSLMHWMKQNCKPTDEVNSFINKIVQMANGPIEVMTCAEDESDASYALSTLHLLDSGWWGRRKLPEGLPWFGRDCHRGQGGAEETGPDFILARWRGGGMVEYFIEQSLKLNSLSVSLKYIYYVLNVIIMLKNYYCAWNALLETFSAAKGQWKMWIFRWKKVYFC